MAVQLLRENTIFEPGGIDKITLAVWQDRRSSVVVQRASLGIRLLPEERFAAVDSGN